MGWPGRTILLRHRIDQIGLRLLGVLKTSQAGLLGQLVPAPPVKQGTSNVLSLLERRRQLMMRLDCTVALAGAQQFACGRFRLIRICQLNKQRSEARRGAAPEAFCVPAAAPKNALMHMY